MNITRLLIANRGEIARRVTRTARRMGMATVAVYSDADGQALHVLEADASVALAGTASADSYLRIDKLIAAARSSGADAVHPGYGFLSENADFAQAVIDAGLIWVGPPPSAIRILGNKSSARELALSLGMTCLPGYQGQDQSDARFTQEAQRIGLPVMVKAAAGGGGRGMRLVSDGSQLAAAVQSARSEAQSAFGSGELLLERALLRPRHVEVQVFADMQGNCIHLGERDCSVQRRHQKIIEESPSPALSGAMRDRMCAGATGLAQAAGYAGAGTVEFLVEGDEFFMMEMNTRLQVEHPVTEMVTGLDLVEWQLRVAQGEALPLKQEQVRFEGHALEVRLCAEDENFVPHSGRISHFVPVWREEGWGEGIRFDHAVFPGMQVTPHYDAMLGKLISHAPTRDEAISQLLAALAGTEILGIHTNRRLLISCLRHARFAAGQALIPFLAEHGDEIRAGLVQEEKEMLPRLVRRALWPAIPTLLACPWERPTRIRHRGHVSDLGPPASGGVAAPVKAVQVGNRHWHVQSAGIDLFFEDASYDPPGAASGAAQTGDLRAPFNGKIIAVKVSAGDRVALGDTLLVIESMKLEHVLSAPRDGVVVEVMVHPGQQAATSQLLVTLEKELESDPN